MSNSKLNILTKGFFKENPTLILVLGCCPTLAVTTSVGNALGMGAATTFVLLMSNIIISALKNVIPDKVRIPSYIVIIATFVSMIDLLIQGFLPALSASLGVFIPLIVVNCIVLGRAEAFANKNSVLDSALDGLGIAYDFISHEPAASIEECRPLSARLNAPILNNLFLTTRRKGGYYLLVMRPDAPFRRGEVSRQAGTSRLCFAPEGAALQAVAGEARLHQPHGPSVRQ